MIFSQPLRLVSVIFSPQPSCHRWLCIQELLFLGMGISMHKQRMRSSHPLLTLFSTVGHLSISGHGFLSHPTIRQRYARSFQRLKMILNLELSSALLLGDWSSYFYVSSHFAAFLRCLFYTSGFRTSLTGVRLFSRVTSVRSLPFVWWLAWGWIWDILLGPMGMFNSLRVTPRWFISIDRCWGDLHFHFGAI